MINNYEFSAEFKNKDVIFIINEIAKQWNVNINQMKIIIDGIPISGKSTIVRKIANELNITLMKYEPIKDLDSEFRGFLKDVKSPVIVDGSPIQLLCGMPNWKRYISRYVKVLDSIINNNYPAFVILVEPLDDEDLIKMSSLYEWDAQRAEWVTECITTFEIMSKTYEIYRHVRISEKVITSDN